METQIIGKNIKLFRERLGLTQEQLADFLGVKREVISYYENGSRAIPVEAIKKLSDFFGIEMVELMEENAHLREANIAFAFRAEELNTKDLESITLFRRIVKNYLKLVKLSRK